MKRIIKLIIVLAAAVFVSVGIACVLISGIAIGSQASVSPDMRAAKINYEASVDAENERHETDKKDLEGEELTEANKLHDSILVQLERQYKLDKLDIKADGQSRLAAAFVETENKMVWNTEDGMMLAEGGKTRLTAAGTTMVVGIAFILVAAALYGANKILDKVLENKPEAKPEEKPAKTKTA